MNRATAAPHLQERCPTIAASDAKSPQATGKGPWASAAILLWHLATRRGATALGLTPEGRRVGEDGVSGRSSKRDYWSPWTAEPIHSRRYAQIRDPS